jgi:ketosteroid isomerase-like protein
MTVSADEVQAWLDAYLAAWQSYDPAQIGALFAEDASYAYHPWDTGDAVLHGRDAIVANWLDDRDEPGSWQAEYRPLLIDGDRAISTGVTRYADGEVYDNLWVLAFDDRGRCTEFVEWFMLRPAE